MPSRDHLTPEEEAERRPLLGRPLSQSPTPISLPLDTTPNPEDTANLALYGVQHILEDNEENRKAVTCSKICKPQYIEGILVPQGFSVPDNVKNACVHRCHDWTLPQTNAYLRRKRGQHTAAATAHAVKAVPGIGTLVDGGLALREVYKAKNQVVRINRDRGHSANTYGTTAGRGGKTRRKRKSRKTRRVKKRKHKKRKSRKHRKSRR